VYLLGVGHRRAHVFPDYIAVREDGHYEYGRYDDPYPLKHLVAGNIRRLGFRLTLFPSVFEGEVYEQPLGDYKEKDGYPGNEEIDRVHLGGNL
jgi:hypothetical protein